MHIIYYELNKDNVANKLAAFIKLLPCESNMRYPIAIKLVLIMLFLVTSKSYASQIEFEDLEQLRIGVKNFLEQQYIDSGIAPEITINQLDKRLRLKKCTIPPEYSLKSNDRKFGNVTVFIECNGEITWSLYIPASVIGYESVLVAKQGIFRGTIIGKQHIKHKKIDLSKAYYGYYTLAEQIIGKQASRTIPTGTIISKLFLELPDIIKNGQEVYIQAKTNSINIQLKGKALSDGKLGQLIKVRNVSSGKIIQAKVISSTKVKVSLD